MMTLDENTALPTLLGGSETYLADFWAEWCGPCKNLMPVLEDLSAEYAGVVHFTKINADQAPQAANHFGVRGLPFLALVSRGEIVATRQGNGTAQQIRSWLDEQLRSIRK